MAETRKTAEAGLQELLALRQERETLKRQNRISKADAEHEIGIFFHGWEGDLYMFEEVFRSLRPGDQVRR